jgi:hypothetical protein
MIKERLIRAYLASVSPEEPEEDRQTYDNGREDSGSDRNMSPSQVIVCAYTGLYGLPSRAQGCPKPIDKR